MRQWRKQHRHFTERNTDETIRWFKKIVTKFNAWLFGGQTGTEYVAGKPVPRLSELPDKPIQWREHSGLWSE